MALTAGREDLARKALGEKQRETSENNELQSVLVESRWTR